MTDYVLAEWRKTCAGPGCQESYSLLDSLPEGWYYMVSGHAISVGVRFCGLPCLRRWAEERP